MILFLSSILLSLNKVIYSIFLSFKSYKLYFFSAFIRVFLFLIVFNFQNNFEELFLIVELITFLFQLFILHLYLNFKYYFSLSNFNNFFRHGLKVFFGNFLYDLLFKVDLLIFATMVSGQVLEDLSMSIIIFEYYYQIIYVVRINLFADVTKIHNELIITKKNSLFNFNKCLNKILKPHKKLIHSFTLIIIIILFALFFINEISFLVLSNTIALILGVLLTVFAHVFQTVFNQTGYPFFQSIYFLTTIFFVSLLYYIFLWLFDTSFVFIASFSSTFIMGLFVYFYQKKIYLKYE